MSENEQYEKFIAESGVGFGYMVSGSDDREKRLKEIDKDRDSQIKCLSGYVLATEENMGYRVLAMLLINILAELKKLNAR